MHSLVLAGIAGVSVAASWTIGFIPVSVVALLAFCIYQVYLRLFSHGVRGMGPPRVHGQRLLGNLMDMSSPYWMHTVGQWAEEHGPVFEITLLNKKFVICVDPEVAKQVLKRPPPLGCGDDKGAQWYSDFGELLFGGPRTLFTADGERWRSLHKHLRPCFGGTCMRNAVPAMYDRVHELVALLFQYGREPVWDVQDLMMRLSLDIICAAAFDDYPMNALAGQDPGNAFVDDLSPVLEEAIENRFALAMAKYLPFLPRVRRFRAFIQRLHARMDDIITIYYQKRGMEPGQPPPQDDASVLGRVLLLPDPVTGAPYPPHIQRSLLLELLIAGHETTGHSLAWCLYLLSQHPEVEARLVGELFAQLGDDMGPDPSVLARLPYLNAFIKETMRVCPASAGGTMRKLQADTIMGGYHVPAGSTVLFPILTIQTGCVSGWADPTKFQPNRWLSSDTREGDPGDGLPNHCSSNGVMHRASPVHNPRPVIPNTDKSDPARPPGLTVRTSVRRADASVAVQTAMKSDGQPGGEAQGWAGPGRREREPSSDGAFLPFSLGPRECIGQTLAMTELRCVLAVLLRRFRFTWVAERGPVVPVVRLTMMAQGGLWMRAEPRDTLGDSEESSRSREANCRAASF
eukprot:jgi/Mesvir1/16650/Mv10189-RA.1